MSMHIKLTTLCIKTPQIVNSATLTEKLASIHHYEYII